MPKTVRIAETVDMFRGEARLQSLKPMAFPQKDLKNRGKKGRKWSDLHRLNDCLSLRALLLHGLLLHNDTQYHAQLGRKMH